MTATPTPDAVRWDNDLIPRQGIVTVAIVAVEEIRADDRIAHVTIMHGLPADVIDANRAIIDAAYASNIYNRPRWTYVRRIFLRGRSVEITTQAHSIATVARGTRVAVIRQNAN